MDQAIVGMLAVAKNDAIRHAAIALSDVLLRLDHIEKSISDGIVEQKNGINDRQFYQDIDYISQCAAEIHNFLFRLSEVDTDLDTQKVTQIIKQVKLETLRETLSTGIVHPKSKEQQSGRVQLFD